MQQLLIFFLIFAIGIALGCFAAAMCMNNYWRRRASFWRKKCQRLKSRRRDAKSMVPAGGMRILSYPKKEDASG